MVRLTHDSGGPRIVKCSQALGDASPLEFDEDGVAYLDDEDAAETLAAVDRHVSIEPAGPDSREEDEGLEDDGFDAESFVDRTPMDDVVTDIESGEYDEHLEAIEEHAERQGVQDAIDERRE